MDVKECYEIIGGDYEDLLKRLGGSEALASKFAKKFLNDPSYNQFKEAMTSLNYEEAFRAAHTLKGVAANLSMTALYEVSSGICEKLRGGKEYNDTEKLKQLDDIYQLCIETIQQI